MAMVNYAHRGASEYYPENTLWSFYAGLEMRANGIETDIQRTADGVLVLHHDDTITRITGCDGAVSDYTCAQLLEMDFGRFKGERFAGERILTLDTFLTHFGHRCLQLALEIKQAGIEEACLKSLNAHGCRNGVTLTSFMWNSLLAVRATDADIGLGFLTLRITPETLDQLQAHRIDQICPRVDLTTTEDMALARKHGFSVRFWGIKDEALMHRALALNGDGMTVNFPDKLTAVLEGN